MLRTAHHDRALQVCDDDESTREVVMTTFTITSLKLSVDIRTMRWVELLYYFNSRAYQQNIVKLFYK